MDVIPQVKTGIGADATVYGFPRALRDAYGRFPVSVHAFLRVRWGTPHGSLHAHHDSEAGEGKAP